MRATTKSPQICFGSPFTPIRTLRQGTRRASFTHFQQAFLKYSSGIESEQSLARQSAETALQLDPHDPFVNLTMGRTEWLENNLEDAGVWLDQSLKLCPNYAFAMYNRGLVDAFLNDGDQAERNIEKSLLLSPSIDPLNYAMYGTRADSHLIRGQYREAVRWVDQAIRIPTAHIHIFLIAAMTHELAGNGDTARRHITRVRQMDPSYTQQDFFRAFPFQDPVTIKTFSDSLSRMNI